MDDFSGFIKLMLCLMVIVLVPFGSLRIFTDMYDNYTCKNYQKITNIETKYVRFDQCYINTGEQWLTMDQYNHILERRLKLTIEE